MHPAVIGELIQVTVGAGEQVACRQCQRSSLAASLVALAKARASDMLESSLVRTVGVGIAILQQAQRDETVAAGTTQPLGKHNRGNAEFAALVGERAHVGLVRERTDLVHLRTELHPDGLQQPRRMNRPDAVASLPDFLPRIEPARHDGEVRQIHNRAWTVGVEQRRGSAGAYLRVVLLDALLFERVSVPQRVERISAADPRCRHVSPRPA